VTKDGFLALFNEARNQTDIFKINRQMKIQKVMTVNKKLTFFASQGWAITFDEKIQFLDP